MRCRNAAHLLPVAATNIAREGRDETLFLRHLFALFVAHRLSGFAVSRWRMINPAYVEKDKDKYERGPLTRARLTSVVESNAAAIIAVLSALIILSLLHERYAACRHAA